MRKYKVPSEKRKEIQNYAERILEDVKMGTIPDEDMQLLRTKLLESAGIQADPKEMDALFDFLISFATSVRSMDDPYEIFQLLENDKGRLTMIAEAQFLKQLDAAMKRYLIPEPKRQEIHGYAIQALQLLKTGKVPKKSLREMRKLLVKYGGDRFDAEEIDSMIDFAVAMASSIKSWDDPIQIFKMMKHDPERMMQMAEDATWKILEEIMIENKLEDDEKKQIRVVAKKTIEGMKTGKMPTADLDELCEMMKAFSGDEFDDDDIDGLVNFVKTFVANVNTMGTKKKKHAVTRSKTVAKLIPKDDIKRDPSHKQGLDAPLLGGNDDSFGGNDFHDLEPIILSERI